MSFSDKFKFKLGKSGKENPEFTPAPAPVPPEAQAPITPPEEVKPASPTLEEVSRLIQEQRKEGEAQLSSMDKEIRAVKELLDKSDVQSRSRREAQEQALTFLQDEAEREIKFLERKLQEDVSVWNRQLAEREKMIQQAGRQAEAGQVEKKSLFAKAEENQVEQLERAEHLLKEQETHLAEERGKWRQALQQKEDDLLTVRQELTRREADLQTELGKQETQRKAAQELWQTRLKELERQWAEKRTDWETALKAKEEERQKLQSTYQEKQTAWHLEQERRIQDMTKRQERATEKMNALKGHLIKETQHWQQLTQTREEQLQQLKVKLLLSESDAKGRMDQAQKVLQDAVAGMTANVQGLQQQFKGEQAAWHKQIEEKEAQFAGLKEDIRGKLRTLEADFSQRMAALNTEKETLTAQMQTLQDNYRVAQADYDTRQAQLRAEQAALESAHQKKIAEESSRASDVQAVLQAQILTLEKQKDEAASELFTATAHWSEELSQREQALKETQTALSTQETELRKRFSQDEEALTRQTEALRSRQRSLERELQKLHENAERNDLEHTAVVDQLQNDHAEKQTALQKRAAEQESLLRKRLEERRLALDQFLNTKKEQEARVHLQLSAKEKERLACIAQIDQLPKALADTLAAKKEAVQQEMETLKTQMAAEEASLKECREEAKTQLQARAAQLAALRSTLEAREKETAAHLRSHEQIFETERQAIEKEINVVQADTERVRTQWQGEVDKKEKEIAAMRDALARKQAEQAALIEKEQARIAQDLAPLEAQRQALAQTFTQERADHYALMEKYGRDIAGLETQAKAVIDNAGTAKAAQDVKFRDERGEWKNRIEALRHERDTFEQAARTAVKEKTALLTMLEEQQHQQAIAYEAKRNELIHTATVKARTLSELAQQADIDLKEARLRLPLDLKEKEEAMTALNQTLAEDQARQAQRMARLDRALATLARRGKQKEEQLRASLQKTKEDWTAKIAAKDSEITALQSTLLAQEAERQGELDRLAKQFAEERFKLEKSKEDFEWKLKDQKEVSERQLTGRRKELQQLEAEVQRAKAQRDHDLAEKTSYFDAEKNKIQGALTALQQQVEDDRRTQEQNLATRDQEMQTLLVRSKERLRILGEEFNQKVGLWKSTNETLRSQVEQSKGHLAQAQDNWEALQKEKTTEIGALRQDLAAWEVRIQSDVQTLERTHDQERQALTVQIRRQESELEEIRAHFAHQLADKEESLRQTQEDIQNKEAASELEWQASLDQWQKDKQALQLEKTRLDKEMQELRRRVEGETQEMEDASSRLRMEIAFKESEIENQRERMTALRERDLSPLQDRVREVTVRLDEEKRINEAALRRKDDDIRALSSRLAIREKRLQEETRRRAKEIETLQKQVSEEEASVRAHFATEKERLGRLREDQQVALTRLAEKERDAAVAKNQTDQKIEATLRQERHDLEESLRMLDRERRELQGQMQTLLQERDNEVVRLNGALEDRDQAMEELRDQSRRLAESLRKRTESLRQARRTNARGAATNAGAWSAFDEGIQHYQNQAWIEAARAFEQCLARDPRWGAAYQYLALSYHAQGDKARAAQVAERALREDPANAELGNWIERLKVSIEADKKAG
jgi:hypothetical protein